MSKASSGETKKPRRRCPTFDRSRPTTTWIRRARYTRPNSSRKSRLWYWGLQASEQATSKPRTYPLRIRGAITIYRSSSFGRTTWPRRE